MLNTTLTTFVGNLAADPDVRFTTTGTAVTELRVMVNRRTRDGNGSWTDAEPTGWSCKVWGDQAQHVADSVQRGDRVLIHGRIDTETWSDKDSGEKRSKPVVHVDEIGPSLAWATARPQKQAKATAGEDGS